jgi:hypothetical protein
VLLQRGGDQGPTARGEGLRRVSVAAGYDLARVGAASASRWPFEPILFLAEEYGSCLE